MVGNIWVFSTGIILALTSIFLFSFKKKNAALIVLAGAAFFLRLYVAHLDAFLHDWDEKFHALVARNMMFDPFVPTLKNGLSIPYDYTAWCCNYIWLHKQPLFLWQMALSMKIFGVSEFAIRYPGVLMGALMVPMVYRIGKLMTDNDTIGFMAAMFLCFSNYQLELISGYYGMDHNDMAFGFYISASIWAYTEYIKSGKFKWVIWIGIFAGCAVLNKWLTGLLVFAGWGINILVHIRNENTRKEILHMLTALAVCTVVFLPWQLYILQAFPKEASYELSYNSKHVFEVVEGHGGDAWFYLDKFPMYFNVDLWKLIPVGLLLVFFIKRYRNRYSIAAVTMFLTTFCFFSFVVASKLQSYMFAVAPIGFILIALTMGTILKWIRIPDLLQLGLAGYFCFLFLDIDGIKKKRDPNDGYRNAKAYNTSVYKGLKHILPPGTNVVTNLPASADVECMFYNKGITAYHYNPSEEEYKILKDQGMKISAFQDHWGYGLPDHMKNDPEVYVIPEALSNL